MTSLSTVVDLHRVLSDPAYAPRHGWHDDHRDADGTPAYRPAVQQVRAEFLALAEVLRARGLCGSCLQLGLGECDASHALWREIFARVVTIDWRACLVDDEITFRPGMDTGSRSAFELAYQHSPYDLIFIDAGHSYEEVRRDHRTYGPLLRPRGIVAFHDALPRAAYPEVEVWRYVKEIGAHVIGDEVGVAWL